jgi:hypothetical protein
MFLSAQVARTLPVLAAVALVVPAVRVPAPGQVGLVPAPIPDLEQTLVRSSPRDPRIARSSPFSPFPNFPRPKTCKHPARHQGLSVTAMSPLLS